MNLLRILIAIFLLQTPLWATPKSASSKSIEIPNPRPGDAQFTEYAIERIKRGAQEGDSNAQFQLGVMYCYGHNIHIKKNIDEGIRLLELAAAPRHPLAPRMLKKFKAEKAKTETAKRAKDLKK